MFFPEPPEFTNPHGFIYFETYHAFFEWHVMLNNFKTLLKFLIWINTFDESAIVHITNNEKQTLILHQAKYILQWKRFLWISNEEYPVRRTKYVASAFLQLYDVCFTEIALESLSKTLVSVALVQIDLLFLVARGVMVQSASYFLHLLVTRCQQIETSFSCLRR